MTAKGLVYVIISTAEIKSLNIEREQLKAYVNLFSGYKEGKIWVQCTEDETATDEYKWRVSIRSRGIKINDVASNYNGGGHDNASGARCKNIDEILNMVKDLDELI